MAALGSECEQKGENVIVNDRYGEWEDERVDGEGGRGKQGKSEGIWERWRRDKVGQGIGIILSNEV